MPNITYSHDSIWSKYRHSSVRDLAWLLLSPPLIKSGLEGFRAFTIDEDVASLTKWLEHLDQDLLKTPNKHPKSIARNHHKRLGLYAEALLTFYFQQAKARGINYQLLARNVQVRQQKKTLGECDFFVRHPNGDIVHIELAVKYYLQIPNGDDQWHHWVGPNAKDRLDIKLKRMITHQLPLPHKQDSQAALDTIKQALNIDQAIISQHLIKGYLFSHNHKAQSPVLPMNTNMNSLKGMWMRRSEFITFTKDNHCDVIFCQKMEWLSGSNNIHSNIMINCPREIEAQIASIDNAIHHSLERNEKKNAPAILLYLRLANDVVFTPLMLVTDYWPETSSPSRSM